MPTTIEDIAQTITVTLPDDLLWSDEFDTSQVAQDRKRTITGALVIFEDTKIKGRSLKLESDDDSGWITRADLLALRSLCELEDTDCELIYRSITYKVRFDRSNGSGIKAVPVVDCSDPSNDAKYALSLSLITVS